MGFGTGRPGSAREDVDDEDEGSVSAPLREDDAAGPLPGRGTLAWGPRCTAVVMVLGLGGRPAGSARGVVLVRGGGGAAGDEVFFLVWPFAPRAEGLESLLVAM